MRALINEVDQEYDGHGPFEEPHDAVAKAMDKLWAAKLKRRELKAKGGFLTP